MTNQKIPWWQEKYGFFGRFYIQGDDSKEGYLSGKKQNLEQRTDAEVRGVIRLLNLRPNSEILDIPCGYGRHSIGLAKKGFKVTGSDINFYHLEKAKVAARKDRVKVRFIKENMIDIKYDSEFDAVINMFFSFGFFDRDEDNLRVLKNFFKALKPGGKFLMHTDVNIPRIINGKYKFNEIRTLKSGGKLKITERYNAATKRINGSWVLQNKNGNEGKKDYSVRVYTKDEFIKLCKRVGFKSCEVYADWSGKTYNEKSEDMIVVATK